jgi:hypothetical protein
MLSETTERSGCLGGGGDGDGGGGGGVMLSGLLGLMS